MNEKVSIQQLVNSLAEKHGLDKKEAEAFVKEFFQLIEEGLEKEFYVRVKGLGIFKLIEVDNRESINVNTGERIEIQGHTKVSFTPDTALRDKVNKPFGHFETVVLEENTVLEGMESEESPEAETEEPIESPVPAESGLEATADKAEEVAGRVVTIADKAEDASPRSLADEIIARELAQAKAARPLMAAASQETFTEPVKKEEVEEKEDEELSVSVFLEEPEKQNSLMKRLVALIAVIVVLCCAGVVYVYYPDMFGGERPTQPMDSQEGPSTVASMPEQPGVLLADSASIVDSLRRANEPVLEETPDSEIDLIPETPTASTADTPTGKPYKIVGTQTTHVVVLGESLGQISTNYYKSKKFWPYILEHNQDILKNPDMVREGMKLKIPELVENK